MVDSEDMRPSAALVALAATVAAVITSACTVTTPGVAYQVRATATVVSTVTATPQRPTRKAFRADVMERGVTGVLRDDYKIADVEAVECPRNQPVVPDTSFECTAQIGGRAKAVTITVMTEDGEYEVGQPR
ncbi:DUF4333 domain-containing protein [Saccharothrix deserti]|uniref:DUF4333 domain-containing protein n=1 Tax=Saccharothrix deserti TaxID=2593674 RepID=UPI00131D4592|nr:DUF4333 domain-containing protein [Saccharothrix deserti]